VEEVLRCRSSEVQRCRGGGAAEVQLCKATEFAEVLILVLSRCRVCVEYMQMFCRGDCVVDVIIVQVLRFSTAGGAEQVQRFRIQQKAQQRFRVKQLWWFRGAE